MGAAQLEGQLEVFATAGELVGSDLSGRTVLVIDVLRATSTIVTALAHGAAGLRPVATVDEARSAYAQAKEDGRRVLLGGERQGLPVAGFDLGNSPRDYTRQAVAAREIICTTTNGTRALQNAAAAGAAEIIPACFLNAAAVADYARRQGRPVAIACAGTLDKFSLDDALCAGLLVDRLAGRQESKSDLAVAVHALFRQMRADLVSHVKACRHGRRLVEIGMAADIEYCCQVDVFHLIGRFEAPAITLAPRSPQPNHSETP